MRTVALILLYLCQVWIVCAIARAVLSWFPITYGSVAHRVNIVLVRVTEPLISPVRRLLPTARVGNVGLDLSFLLVIVLLQFLVVPFLASHAY